MATSGTNSFIFTRNQLVYAALRKVGAYAIGQTPRADYISLAVTALDTMVQHWHNRGVFLWTKSDMEKMLSADVASYALDAAIVDIENVYFRNQALDSPMDALTREEYKKIGNKAEVATPSRYYVDRQLAASTVYLWPIYHYNTGLVLGTDGKYYVCKIDHTSAATTRPVTGADYADYWEETVLTTTAVAWLTATAYYSGSLKATKILRLQDFGAASDNPDFPVKWYKALLWGCAFDIAPEFGIRKGSEYDNLKMDAERYFLEAKGGDQEFADLQVSPNLGYRG